MSEFLAYRIHALNAESKRRLGPAVILSCLTLAEPIGRPFPLWPLATPSPISLTLENPGVGVRAWGE